MKPLALLCLTAVCLTGALLPAGWAAPTAAEEPEPAGFHTLQLGDRAPDFALPGVDGKRYRLADFQDASELMVIFLCNHCPVSHAAETRLIPFVAKMRGKSVAVVAINPNNDQGLQIDELGYTKYGENFAGSKAHAQESGFNFPYLYDGDTQSVAKAYGCLTTPHVFIFDRDRRLRYQGRFDDSDLLDPASVHAPDAINAMMALVDGRPVPVAETRPVGCSTKWSGKATVVAEFDAAWKKLPVTVDPIDAAGVAALARNPTDKLRVINLWATWCVPCAQEFPALVMESQRFMRRDFELITISMDDPKLQPVVLRFLQKQHAAVPPKIQPAVLQEGRKTNNYLYQGGGADAVAKALDPQWPGPLPYTVVIAPGGKIVARWNGPIDPTEFQNKITDLLGGFRHRSQM
jgi:peroxiredoxin